MWASFMKHCACANKYKDIFTREYSRVAMKNWKVLLFLFKGKNKTSTFNSIEFNF